MKPENYILNVYDADPNNEVWDLPVTANLLTDAGDEFTNRETWSRRNLLPPVGDQGTIGSCVGYSGAGILSDDGDELLENPSAMWIYKMAKTMDIWPGENYSGTSIKGACTALRKLGCCDEKFWPYVSTEETSPNPGAFEHAAHNKIHSYYKITIEDINNVKRILKTRSLWISINVLTTFYNPGNDGFYNDDTFLNGEKRGGHAVGLIGWTTKNGQLYWELRNSWTDHWGDDGHCFIRHDHLCKIMHGGAYVVISNAEEDAEIKEKRIERAKFFSRVTEFISVIIEKILKLLGRTKR